MKIAIIDFESGNLKSVFKAVEFASKRANLNSDIQILNSNENLKNFDKIILPGQGSFKQCYNSLTSIEGMLDGLNEVVLNKQKPILGICVGMQLFSNFGEEDGGSKGFGWIKGDVKKIQYLLDKKVYEEFNEAIKERNSKGLISDTTFIGINSSEVKEHKQNKNMLEVTVEFVSEIISHIKDKENKTVSGDPEKIKKVHDYIDSLSETGKVLSLASTVRVAEKLNEGKELDSLELALLYKRVPKSVKDVAISPYVSFERNQARINVRILDSNPDLRRDNLIRKIEDDMLNKLGFNRDSFYLTGVLVLYNNMLQSLFNSQILSMGFVMIGITVMFLILFKSLSLAVIGIIPNLLAAGFVLGLMGLIKLPLDMMTITIAAIAIGIAVDNSIHYIYRFREEYNKTKNYSESVYRSHDSIGRAIFFTGITIIFGFSILVLSNFIPTIIFGLLTGLAMFIALVAVLTLLPKLLISFKPF